MSSPHFAALALIFIVAAAPPQLTRPPQVVRDQVSEYPAEAAARHISGDVQFHIDLNETGQIIRIEVVQSPDKILTEAAESALFQMAFSPAEVDHQPAAVRIDYTYQFKLPTAALPEKAPLVLGLVQDDTGAGVSNAVVRVEPGVLLARTTQAGEFSLSLPAAGSYVLYVTGAGLEPEAMTLDAHSDETMSLKILVHPAGAADYETTVHAQAPNYEISRQQLSRDELRSVPGAFGDPLRVLEALPGLGRSPFATGILVMRGSSPDDSAVYMDGHPLPLLYHFGGGPSIVPPEAIGALDLQPGSFAARYGRATAGIVEIETRPGHPDAYHGGAHVSVLDAGATADGALFGHGSFRLAARRSYIDAILPWVQRSLGHADSLSLSPRYWDYFARFDVDATGWLKLMFTAHGSDDLLTFDQAHPPFNLPANFALHTGLNRLNPRMIATFNDLTLDVSPIVFWLTDHGETPYTFSDLDTFAQGIRTEVSGQIGRHSKLFLGVDYLRSADAFVAETPSAITARDFPAPDPHTPPQTQTHGTLVIEQTGIYAQANLHHDALSLIPGLRMEHAEFAEHAATTFDPRLAARYALNPTVATQAAFGIYHRLPLPEQIAPSTGNPTLDFERSYQATVGVEWNIDTAHSVNVQTYAKYMDDLTIPSAAVLTSRNQPARYLPTGEGRAAGLEILVRRKLFARVMGWVSYSLSISQRRDRDALPWQLYARDQTHNLNVLLAAELSWAIHVGGRFRYVTGYPVRPIVGTLFDADAGNYTPQTAPTFSDRLPPFIQLDLRADKEFSLSYGITVLVFLDVQNVTNRQNAEFYQYSQDYSQRYAYPGLPFLPSLGVEVHF